MTQMRLSIEHHSMIDKIIIKMGDLGRDEMIILWGKSGQNIQIKNWWILSNYILVKKCIKMDSSCHYYLMIWKCTIHCIIKSYCCWWIWTKVVFFWGMCCGKKNLIFCVVKNHHLHSPGWYLYNIYWCLCIAKMTKELYLKTQSSVIFYHKGFSSPLCPSAPSIIRPSRHIHVINKHPPFR